MPSVRGGGGFFWNNPLLPFDLGKVGLDGASTEECRSFYLFKHQSNPVGGGPEQCHLWGHIHSNWQMPWRGDKGREDKKHIEKKILNFKYV